jgi:hypothetical protein
MATPALSFSGADDLFEKETATTIVIGGNLCQDRFRRGTTRVRAVSCDLDRDWSGRAQVKNFPRARPPVASLT